MDVIVYLNTLIKLNVLSNSIWSFYFLHHHNKNNIASSRAYRLLIKFLIIILLVTKLSLVHHSKLNFTRLDLENSNNNIIKTVCKSNCMLLAFLATISLLYLEWCQYEIHSWSINLISQISQQLNNTTNNIIIIIIT